MLVWGEETRGGVVCIKTTKCLSLEMMEPMWVCVRSSLYTHAAPAVCVRKQTPGRRSWLYAAGCLLPQSPLLCPGNAQYGGKKELRSLRAHTKVDKNWHRSWRPVCRCTRHSTAAADAPSPALYLSPCPIVGLEFPFSHHCRYHVLHIISKVIASLVTVHYKEVYRRSPPIKGKKPDRRLREAVL